MSLASPKLVAAMIMPDLRDEYSNYDLPSPRFGSALVALLEGVAQIPALQLHVVACVREKMSAPERLAENVFYHPCFVPRWGWLKMGYLPCIAAIRRALARFSPDVVHGQGTERYCALTSVLSCRPSVVTVHGNMRAVARALGAKPLSFHGLTAQLEVLTLPRAAGVICLNNYTRDQVGNLAENKWLIPNAVGSEFFDVDRLPDHKPRPFCPALICNYKNQNALIKALDGVARELPFTLRFGGTVPEDSYGAEFRKLVAARHWCEYVGLLSGPALKEEYSRAAMVVLPSLEDNCPMAILEAMAMGVPIAGASVGGIPELVEHDVNGVLFDPRSDSQIASAISRCLRSPELLVRFGEESRKRALKSHSPKTVASQHYDVYRQLVDRMCSRRVNGAVHRSA